MEELIRDDKCAYIRTGRNPVEDVYTEDDCPFEMNKSTRIGDGEDVVIVGGEMVRKAVDALEILKSKGIEAHLLDMYCVKPIDKDAIIRSAKKAKLIVTVGILFAQFFSSSLYMKSDIKQVRKCAFILSSR